MTGTPRCTDGSSNGAAWTTWMVESDTGMMGGKSAHEFMAPSPSGEDRLVLCSNCDYAANLEVARSIPRPPVFPDALDAPQQVETPDVTTIEGWQSFWEWTRRHRQGDAGGGRSARSCWAGTR